ncbi:hypothetical protein [Capnocytophaga canis]|uniref:Uncharacterized protein n=1 Tax=Capnocytophaga canis TaxID=1848903 RepID=A0A0B7IRZ2_9FLAO|nr:hypothetical protein [Capnocytophaga canis]CEN53394.1 conserved hypothetical protein [Capnocytophaga canis]
MEQTPHEKTLIIIKELELSARQVAVAIGKTGSAVAKKQNQENGNKFLSEDFEKLKSFYIKKLEKIKTL